MPSSLALLLCTAFVAFLLFLDHRQGRKASLGSWVPTLWLLAIASKPLSAWLGTDTGGGDAEGSPLDSAVLSCILLVGILMVAVRQPRFSLIVRQHGWLVAVLIYALVSVLWSDQPYISFRRWVRELLAVVMALVVIVDRNPQAAVTAILRRTTYILIPFSLLVIKYFPQFGVEYGLWNGELIWVGMTVQKNGLGRVCLISVFYLVWTLNGRWRRGHGSMFSLQTTVDMVLLAMAGWLLIGGRIGGYSATAIAALAGGISMLLLLQFARNYNARLLTGICVAAIVLVFVVGTALPLATAGGSIHTTITGALGRNDTLTGRTEIWGRLIPFFESRPIVGYGFGGFWTSEIQGDVYGVKEAHNGYLATCLELGIVGLLAIGAYLFSMVRRAARAIPRDKNWGILCLCFIFMLLIHNVTEASMNSLQRHLTAIVILVSVALPVGVRRRRERDRPVSTPSEARVAGTLSANRFRPGVSADRARSDLVKHG